ncbi:MAG TPA: ATP-binding protein [Streptosporangiaceae bacterium]|nr:ATP-binding protein [Streptosporangiaceae bacterium]
MATRTPALHAGSVRAGRDFAVATLDRWGMRERCGDVAVVVSELLSNALRHALPAPGGHTPPWPIRFGMLQQGRWVMCAVSDPSAQPPVPGEPDYLAESGRGLHVINALSDTWGCTPPSILGKAVWAMFSVGRSPRVP